MTKKLRVYLPFALNEIKRQMAYKGAFYLFLFTEMFASFIAFYLWMAIYKSSESGSLGGMTQQEMVVYVFISFITSQMVMVSISEQISDDVIKGTVAMNLIKPIDYRTSLLSVACGQMVYRFFVPSMLIWAGLEAYRYFGMGTGNVAWWELAAYLISCILSMFIYVLFDFCFGMIAFFTSYIFGLQLVKSAILSFLTGQLIPLSFFPDAVQKVFSFLPFSSMVYTPTMIYLGKYTGRALFLALGKQMLWVLLLYLLGSIIWKQVTKRLVVLGG